MKYIYDLTDLPNDTFQHTPMQINFGDYTLWFVFQWPEYVYREYQQLMIQLVNRADGDPLTNIGRQVFNRDYNWLQWYNSVPDNASEEWLEEQEWLPLSVRNSDDPLHLIAYTKYMSEEIQQRVDIYKQLLRWRFEAYDSSGKVLVTGNVQIGGIYMNQDTDYSFSFTSDFVESIGFNDLSRTSILFEVKDE